MGNLDHGSESATHSSNHPSLVYEMCHKLPFPLSPRVFPVLVVTAKTDPLSFIVVQIPVNVNSLQEAFYSSGRNIKEGDSEVKRKRPVIGYVALSLPRASRMDICFRL